MSFLYGLLYVLILTPVAFVYRLAGFDALQMKTSKALESGFLTRNHVFSKADFESA